MKKKESILFFIALILFSLVSLNIYLWISISSNHAITFEQAKSEYLKKFPEIIRNAKILTLFNILLLSIAAFLFYKLKSVSKLQLWIKILLTISILLIGWQVFSLM